MGGAEANRRVLVTERDKVRWRNPDPVTEVLRRGVLVTDGEEHDHYRRLMESHMRPSTLPDYAQAMIAQTDRVQRDLAGRTSRRHAGRRPQDRPPDRDGHALRRPRLGRSAAHLEAGAQDHRVHIAGRLDPVARHPAARLPGPMRRLDEYLYEIIRTRRAAPARADLLQHLIDAGLDDDRIRDQMLTMLIAGHDTSTALLAWAFYLLGSNPQIKEQLTIEIREALGTDTPTSSAGWQPPLLDHVIKESLRLYPPIHLGNRMLAEEMEFNGQRVAAGERMFYSIYLTHRDPEYWDDAERFCPERFASGRKTPPFAYVPFGGGPRSCIGAAYGQAEARLVLGRLLQTHQFDLMPRKVHAHMGATLEPRPGVFMRVTERKP